MSTGKIIFTVGGIGVILILLAIRLGWFNALQKTTPASPPDAVPKLVKQPAAKSVDVKPKVQKTASAKTSSAASPGKAAAEDEKLLGSGDPFEYAANASGGYTPLAGNKNVGIITVKGIIRIDGEEPKAILHLKDSDRVHYVSKDSVVRVSTGNKKGNSPAEAYIVVKDIRNDEVELIQLERPDKVIIIR